MTAKVKNILLYGGTTRDIYQKMRKDITESNRINMMVFSAIGAFGMLIMTIVSYMDSSLIKNRGPYFACVIVCVILFLVNFKLAKGKAWLVFLTLYILVGIMFAFGIVLGTFVEPNQMTVSFAVLLFAVPLLFTDKPIRMILAILIGILVYIFAASITQNSTMFWYNFTNIIPYGMISMIVSSYMMQIKIRRHLLEYENRYLIESDQMTGLLNRRSYEYEIAGFREKGCPLGLKICTMDVNGLKVVNDSAGHQVGDELIKNAAACIEKVFAAYGKCYRTGGDEFVTILEGSSPKAEELKNQLALACRETSTENIPELSISIGIVEAENSSDIDQLIREADRAMYRFKAEYYSRRGIDRRKLRKADL